MQFCLFSTIDWPYAQLGWAIANATNKNDLWCIMGMLALARHVHIMRSAMDVPLLDTGDNMMVIWFGDG